MSKAGWTTFGFCADSEPFFEIVSLNVFFKDGGRSDLTRTTAGTGSVALA